MSVPTNKKLYEMIKSRVKSRVLRWPSAYASGQLVKEYSNAMRKMGKKPYTSKKKGKLTRWFREKWIDIKTGLQGPQLLYTNYQIKKDIEQSNGNKKLEVLSIYTLYEVPKGFERAGLEVLLRRGIQ
jgi:hypothetical protein